MNVRPDRPQIVFRVLILAGLLLLTGCRGPSWRATSEARVVGIAGVDTIDVLRGLNTVKARLNGIDCPENGQPFGLRAKLLTSELAIGRAVTIVPESRDRYEPVFADVILPDRRFLKRELVAAGLAWHDTKYSKEPQLARLERREREARIGIWSEERTFAPWDFRADEKGEPG